MKCLSYFEQIDNFRTG